MNIQVLPTALSNQNYLKTKTITVFFILLHSIMLFSQEKFSIDVFLEPNSTSIADEYGNQQFALNTLVNFSIQLKETDSGYFFLGQSIEYANLTGGEYFRYAILQVGYSFNPFILKNLTANVAVNYGITKRWSQGFTNYGATFDLSYRFSDRLKLASLVQLVRRNDVEESMDMGGDMHRLSFFLGIKLDLFRIRTI